MPDQQKGVAASEKEGTRRAQDQYSTAGTLDPTYVDNQNSYAGGYEADRRNSYY